MKCDCYIETKDHPGSISCTREIIYCEMHETAPKVIKALESQIEFLQKELKHCAAQHKLDLGNRNTS